MNNSDAICDGNREKSPVSLVTLSFSGPSTF